MSDTYAVAILAGLAAMLGWGSADFLAKRAIDVIGDLASLLWGHVFGAIAIVLAGIVYLLISGTSTGLPTSPLPWLGLLAFGAGQASVYLLVYRAFSKGPVSLLSPVFASYSGIAAALSIVLGEVVGAATVALLALMFCGVLIASLEGRATRDTLFEPGVAEALLGASLAAAWTLAWSRFVHGHAWFAYTTIMYLAMASVIAVAAVTATPRAVRPPQAVMPWVIAIGITEVIAYVAIGIGFSRTRHVSTVAVISGAFPVLTILLARTFLGERMSQLRWIGVGIVILAGLLLPIVS